LLPEVEAVPLPAEFASGLRRAVGIVSESGAWVEAVSRSILGFVVAVGFVGLAANESDGTANSPSQFWAALKRRGVDPLAWAWVRA
jgi:hypothetical protein